MNIRKNVDYSAMFDAMQVAMSADMSQMKLYCELGRLICQCTEKGAAVAAAEYLQRNYPNVPGLSPRNLRRMRDFYHMYAGNPELLDLAMQIGWTQNVVILEADLNTEEQRWYLCAVQQLGWSKAELQRRIESQAHQEVHLDELEGQCYTKREKPKRMWCKVELLDIVKLINAVPITEQTVITQLKHVEDDEPYQVWSINTGAARYILKEAKEDEAETYQWILSELNDDCIPTIFQRISAGESVYLLMEYVDGENLCKCDRRRLTLALDALISLQRKTWNSQSLASYGYSFEKSLRSREHRGRFLNDPLLEEAYEKFMKIYHSVPRALCHDDLLPFNVIASDHRAVLIDWECGGILPYPTSFARLIAHGEDTENALFFMTPEDRAFAIDYYYENLLKDMGISYTEWRKTLEHFLFYEYCEWVFVGNKYDAKNSDFYKEYLPIAKHQAEKLR